MKKVLRFHIGRGGRFFNPGFMIFIGFEKLEEGDKNFIDFYPDENGGWKEDNGNELDYMVNEDGTGYINIDNDYDKDVWELEDNLSSKQIDALLRAKDGFYKDEIKEILEKYYEDYITD